MPARLNPYLTFAGTAREAMEFYRTVFGGELSLTTFAEGGMPHDPADAGKVMHAQLDAPNSITLMASDPPGGMPVGPMSGMSISLSGDDDALLSGWFERLGEGGTIVEPLVQAPWGDRFGMLTDRFGVPWMVNIAGAHPAG